MFEETFSEAELGKIGQKLDNKAYDTNEKGCRLWQGAKDKDGYGRMRVTATDVRGVKHQVTASVPRLVLFLAINGSPIPIDRQSSHLCHNTACYNRDHLNLEPPELNNQRKRCMQQRHCTGHLNNPNCIP